MRLLALAIRMGSRIETEQHLRHVFAMVRYNQTYRLPAPGALTKGVVVEDVSLVIYSPNRYYMNGDKLKIRYFTGESYYELRASSQDLVLQGSAAEELGTHEYVHQFPMDTCHPVCPFGQPSRTSAEPNLCLNLMIMPIALYRKLVVLAVRAFHLCRLNEPLRELAGRIHFDIAGFRRGADEARTVLSFSEVLDISKRASAGKSQSGWNPVSGSQPHSLSSSPPRPREKSQHQSSTRLKQSITIV